MISFKQNGDFSKTTDYLKRSLDTINYSFLSKYGQKGVDALIKATPKDTGKTAASWRYRITHNKGEYRIIWENTNIQNGIPIAIIIQYGHAAKNGTWVQGRDYINPALRPVLDEISNEIWKEVKKL